ncbi:MAG: FkbM family methyltransferase [Rhodospirillaceae bacterium]|nr:FkbM family methyltransferase [Rhodospirillaceae bacterium]MBT5034471.1 FkbM family methyltransferase [Rhodospirillaceae bacterium]MBT7487611.1 FkbM family methyltransferase [Rhodospirillales bacterium]
MSVPEIYKQVDAKYGRMLYNPNDKYIGRSLNLYGEFSEGEIALFRQLIKPGFVVLDIGANIGCHTVFMAQAMENSGRVIAIEPQRLTHQLLCANVALNSLFNVQCFNNAVGDSEGSITVPVLNPRSELNFGGLDLRQHKEGETIKQITIDSLNLLSCEFIKLDIEGMELMALMGARETISKYMPPIYLENDRKENSDDIIRFLTSMGYRMYWHLPPLFNPNNHRKNPNNIFGDIVSRNMFCIPTNIEVNVTNMQEVKVPAEP